ncbi:helix-turn-helix transcriptional regulator [Anatilimnocola sp. NA78]|uniref:helix-turn-helix transcriptional regulator n=1 Tax=Anatilimnocola sp. NA78 TaxID=3415683 RepID=UPI003CE54903
MPEPADKPLTEQKKKSRWNIEKRLEFIDFRLYWEGRINRSDLVEFFGVSVPQASADLAHYQLAAPKNAVYDKTLKTYVAGADFEPKYFSPSAHRYLAQLRLMDSGTLEESEAWANRLPSCSIVPMLRRRIDPTMLRRILDAIRTNASIEIQYQSMSRPEPKSRWISPHAIAFDGFRWHTRAWCHNRSKFLDFVLGRIQSVNDSAKPSEIDPASDMAWAREITLRLQPNPELKGGKRRVVELDFGMTDGVVEMKVRLCLAFYLERQFNLDRGLDHPESLRQLVFLANREELIAARKMAGIDVDERDI